MTTANLDVQPGAKLVWESVITNAGGGFYPGTAEFICPENGLYSFSMTGISTNSYIDIRVNMQLMYNDQMIVTSVGFAGHGWASSTQSAVIECYNGDRVWVRCAPDIPICNIMGRTDYHATSFSGFKLGA